MDIASHAGGSIKIAVPRLNRIANFDDLDPLSAMPDVTVEMIEAGRPLPGDADLILIPGSKSTIADLAHFRAQGWDVDLQAHVRRGGRVLGICGGYQMLGQEIIDADGIEGPPSRVNGLGLLNVVTQMKPEKRLALTQATHVPSGDPVSGYEIHIGVTDGPDRARAWLDVDGRHEGAASADGQVMGCYLHGIFAADSFRTNFVSALGQPVAQNDYGQDVQDTLDALADHLKAHMDLDLLLRLAAEV